MKSPNPLFVIVVVTIVITAIVLGITLPDKSTGGHCKGRDVGDVLSGVCNGIKDRSSCDTNSACTWTFTELDDKLVDKIKAQLTPSEIYMRQKQKYTLAELDSEHHQKSKDFQQKVYSAAVTHDTVDKRFTQWSQLYRTGKHSERQEVYSVLSGTVVSAGSVDVASDAASLAAKKAIFARNDASCQNAGMKCAYNEMMDGKGYSGTMTVKGVVVVTAAEQNQFKEQMNSARRKMQQQRASTDYTTTNNPFSRALMNPHIHNQNHGTGTNQAVGCNDCWAISTAEVTSAFVSQKRNIEAPELSYFQVAQCAIQTGDRGGCGVQSESNPEVGMTHVKKHGLTLYTDYVSAGGLKPNNAVISPTCDGGSSDACFFKPNVCLESAIKPTVNNMYRIETQVTKFSTQDPMDEETMKSALDKYGPLAMAIDAGSNGNLLLQATGVLTPAMGMTTGCPNPAASCGLDHAVVLVGYGTDAGIDYWRIKNSWGVNAGEDGYFRVKRGVQAMGIGYMTVWPEGNVYNGNAKDSGLSVGAIIGIAFGGVVFITVVFLVVHKHHKSQKS